MTPVVKVLNTDSFYEKAFASTSAICILFAGAASILMLGLNIIRLDYLFSSDFAFVLFVVFCCIVNFFICYLKHDFSVIDMYLQNLSSQLFKGTILIIRFLQQSRKEYQNHY